MGINAQILKLILEEDKHSSLSGKCLCLGQNTIHVKPELLKKLSIEYGKELPENWESSTEWRDTITKTSKRVDYPCFLQTKLFELWFKDLEHIEVLDCSEYEKAGIIIDLNLPIDSALHEKYDFIYDGSVLDNIFNPAQGIANVHKLLKPGGRFASVNAMNFLPGAMSSLSCEWYYAFFAQNNYSDAHVYLNALPIDDSVNSYNNVFDWYSYSPTFTPNSEWDAGKASNDTYSIYSTINVIAIGRKGDKNSSAVEFPQNLQYCFKETDNWASKIYESRAELSLEWNSEAKPTIFGSDHYQYRGSF